jgi:hypothetical protein
MAGSSPAMTMGEIVLASVFLYGYINIQFRIEEGAVMTSIATRAKRAIARRCRTTPVACVLTTVRLFFSSKLQAVPPS